MRSLLFSRFSGAMLLAVTALALPAVVHGAGLPSPHTTAGVSIVTPAAAGADTLGWG